MNNTMMLADYIINLCNKKYKCGLGSTYKQPITHLYLNKLLYFLNIQYMLKNHKPLVPNHSFHIWAYGPVIPSVWSTYQQFGDDRITHICKSPTNIHTDKNGNIKAKIVKYTNKDVPMTIKALLKSFLPSLLVFNEFRLVSFSRQNPQWKQVWDNNNFQDRANAIKHTFDEQQDYRYYSHPQNQFWRNHLAI